ncbi:hypothetical protein CVS40_11276 [Lucilia cuprina]|nr:hypothetical protein CVS40_11276 [Lucilia cuprina]
MSLERTPPQSVQDPQENIPTTSNNSTTICFVCRELMLEAHECLILTNCSHVFHRLCIESSLSHAAKCPECHKPCDLADLKKIIVQNLAKPNLNGNTNPKANQNVRGKGRGAMSKRYNTRNVTKTLFQESQQFNSSNIPSQEEETPAILFTPNQVRSNTQNHFSNVQQISPDRNLNQNSLSIDPSQLSQLIETSVVSILQNLNITPNVVQNENPYTQRPNNPLTQASQQPPNVPSNANRIPSSFSNNRDDFNVRFDKVTSIIQNWNLKFDGSSNGLSVDEFLYRIRSLTADNFNNDFSLICKNLHILLSGKARDWYWRYHKQVDNIQWEEFCAAIKYQYKDFKSNFDLREELRNRKMKSSESFDTFFEAISVIIDRLDRPIPESELIEI